MRELVRDAVAAGEGTCVLSSRVEERRQGEDEEARGGADSVRKAQGELQAEARVEDGAAHVGAQVGGGGARGEPEQAPGAEARRGIDDEAGHDGGRAGALDGVADAGGGQDGKWQQGEALGDGRPPQRPEQAAVAREEPLHGRDGQGEWHGARGAAGQQLPQGHIAGLADEAARHEQPRVPGGGRDGPVDGRQAELRHVGEDAEQRDQHAGPTCRSAPWTRAPAAHARTSAA